MKNICFLLAILGSAMAVRAQTSGEVLFDNYISEADNDLANFFEGDYAFHQIPTDGITGGCIDIQDNYNGGWDLAANDGYAFYRELFTNDFDSLKASISFKYRAADSLFLPAAILRISTVSDQKDTASDFMESFWAPMGLFIVDGSNTSIMGLTDLDEGKWYRLTLILRRDSFGDWEALTGTNVLEDIGTDGLAEPVILGSYSDHFINVAQFYAPETSIKIGLGGNKDGGGQYLDNFNFSIYYPSDPSSVSVVNSIPASIPTVFHDRLPVLLPPGGNYRYCLYDISGKIFSSGILGANNNINTEALAQGIYFIAVQHSNARLIKKIIKQ